MPDPQSGPTRARPPLYLYHKRPLHLTWELGHRREEETSWKERGVWVGKGEHQSNLSLSTTAPHCCHRLPLHDGWIIIPKITARGMIMRVNGGNIKGMSRTLAAITIHHMDDVHSDSCTLRAVDLWLLLRCPFSHGLREFLECWNPSFVSYQYRHSWLVLEFLRHSVPVS